MADIIVRFRIPGFHRWPAAPNHRAYLAQTHRHLFHVEARMPVTHDDREVEFHDFLDDAKGTFESIVLRQENDSCERLAMRLARALVDVYRRPVQVQVFEDGEVGAEVTLAGDLPPPGSEEAQA